MTSTPLRPPATHARTTETGGTLWDTHLPVAELVTSTLHTAGPYSGHPVSLVRLGMCNLACDCDTPQHTPPATVLAEHSAREIADSLLHANTAITLLSGGEPLMHQARPALRELLIKLAADRRVHVETNGTIAPRADIAAMVQTFIVAPKLAGATPDPHGRRIKPEVLRVFREMVLDGQAAFRFDVADVADLEQVDDIVAEVEIPPDVVWIVPTGGDPDTLTGRHRQVLTETLRRGWCTATRLQVLTTPAA